MEETRTLIEQIKAEGNSRAATKLVEKYQSRVFSFCLTLVRQREIAEEIAQDAFLKALNKLPSLKDNDKFFQWMMRITYHIAIDYLRKKRMRFDEIEKAGVIKAEDNPHVDLFYKDRRKFIEGILSRLPMEERTVLTLYYLQDQSIKQIEAITGMKQSNVKVKLFRSREALRKKLLKNKMSL